MEVETEVMVMIVAVDRTVPLVTTVVVDMKEAVAIRRHQDPATGNLLRRIRGNGLHCAVAPFAPPLTACPAPPTPL